MNAVLIDVLNGENGQVSPLGTLARELAFGTLVEDLETRLVAAEAELGGAGAMTTLTLEPTIGDISVGGLVYSDPTASTAITGTTETNTNFDNTFSIPANSLGVGGKGRIKARGIYTATTGTETHVFNVMLGSTSIGVTGNLDPANDNMWSIDYEFDVRAIGASGSVVGSGICTTGGRGAVPVQHLLGTGSGSASHTAIDTTAALVLAIAIDRQGTATDSDSARMDSISFEYTPPPAA